MLTTTRVLDIILSFVRFCVYIQKRCVCSLGVVFTRAVIVGLHRIEVAFFPDTYGRSCFFDVYFIFSILFYLSFFFFLTTIVDRCRPVNKIAFMKTHKCASSTIENILFRYKGRPASFH